MEEGKQAEEGNLVLFPKTLDLYQLELTRMLETDRYAEAAELLQFLLRCEVQDARQYEEWQALLNWLKEAFPNSLQPEGRGQQAVPGGDEEDETDFARSRALAKFAEDSGYALRLLDTVTEKPLSEHTFLALEQLVFLDSPEIDKRLTQWLEQTTHHPILEFRVLQTLRKRGALGQVVLKRNMEQIRIDIETIPLTPEDFPPAVLGVVERVAQESQVHNPALFYFAQEFWFQFIMGAYGTADYESILSEEDASLDIWAAALHQTVSESLQGDDDTEEIRDSYGITDSMRLRYEQAHRAMRSFATGGAIF